MQLASTLHNFPKTLDLPLISSRFLFVYDRIFLLLLDSAVSQEMVTRSLLLLFVLVSVLVEDSVELSFSSRLIHRFSDELKAARVSRSGDITGGKWPQKRSLEYYRMLLSSDVQRQRMRLGPQYQFLFPSEGSKTMSLGNDFGWCSLVFGASIMQDRDLNEYSPSQSSTSKHISCSHQLCEVGPSCKSPKQPCPYSVGYYTENTLSSGLLVEDILHLASEVNDSQNTKVQAPVIIGCGMNQTGGYLDGFAPDGLMGLGLSKISVPSFLAKSGLIQNSFSMCFDEDDSGRIFFGDQGPATQQSTSFLPLDGNYTTYIIGVEGCCVGKSCPKQTSFKALMDSGTSFTFLPHEVYETVAEEFDRQVNATISSFEGYPWKYCYKSSSTNPTKVPTMKLTFPLNNSFVIHNPVFMIYGIQGIIGFCLAIQPADGDIGTIGQNFMTGYRMVFNRESLKLGWSRSNCEDQVEGTPDEKPLNPLPTNEQQSTPAGRAVSPAVAGRAPAKPSAASAKQISTQGCLLELLLLQLLLLASAL